MEGTTKSGFKYQLSAERLENYELIEALAELEESPIALTKVVNLLLSKEQVSKLKEHLRDENGLVSTQKMSDEVMEIFQGTKELKNS